MQFSVENDRRFRAPMRDRFVIRLFASALAWGALSNVHAQTTIMRGMHEPARVTVVEPAAQGSDQTTPEGTATAVSPVTVEAKRLTPPEVQKQSLRFVQTYSTPTAKLGQFARWRDPICIEVTGVNVDEAKLVERVKEVAKPLGVKVLKPGCRANVEIIFSERPQRWVDWVAEHRQTILGFHYAADTDALKKVSRAVQAWYETATRSDSVSSGQLMFAGFGGHPLPGASAKAETIDDPSNSTAVGCGESRLTSCLQSVFKNVLLFVDGSGIKDQDPVAVSDYIAMLVLSQSRSHDDCAGFVSILDLLAPGCRRPAPDGLTSADIAYLKALYSADLEARRASEETDIAGRMAASLIKARSRTPAEAAHR